MGINTNAVQRLYVAYFNRPGDPVGMAHWEAQLPATAATQAQLAAIAAGFSGSAEYTALYAGQSNTSIVNNLYLNLFGRAAETAGLISWAGKLTAGTETFASIALQLTYSAQGTDATAIANKLTAANSFTTALDTAAEIVGYSGSAAASSGRTYLAAVTDVATTLTTATTGLTASVAAAVAAGTTTAAATGTTFTLTTGTDSVVGTANNDTINGLSAATIAATTDTLTVADIIDGGAGTDTLTLTASATNTDVTDGALISNMEIVNVRNIAATTVVATYGAGVGVTAVNSYLSTGDVTITGLATGATVGYVGNTAVVNGALSATYSTAATGASTLNISGGTTIAAGTTGNVVIVGAGITSQVINSTGAANTIGTLGLTATSTALTINAATGLTIGAITSNGMTGVTVTGAASTAATPSTPAANDNTSAVQLGGLGATVTTIDASAMTAGGVSAAMIAGITSFKGGAGNDTVTTFATTSQTASIIDAGAGTGDVLRVNAVATIDTATENNTYANFEVVDAMALTGTIDMALFTKSTITSLRSGAGSVFTNVTATQAADVTVYGTAAGSPSFTLLNAVANVTDVLTLKITDGLVASNAFTLGNIVAANVETINLVLTDSLTVTTLAAGATGFTTINVSGTADLTSLTTGALALNANSKIDASTSTGAITITAAAATNNGIVLLGSGTKTNVLTGSSLADTITGGSGTDTIVAGAGSDTIAAGAGTNAITGGAGQDTMSGGAGVDTFIFGASTATDGFTESMTAGTFGGIDTITGFTVGTDKIQITGGTEVISTQATAVQTAVTALTAGSTTTQILTAMALANTTDVGVAIAVFEGSTYILYEVTGADTAATAASITDDIAIKLTGVTTFSTTAVTADWTA